MQCVKRVEDGILEKLVFIKDKKEKKPTAGDLKGMISEIGKI